MLSQKSGGSKGKNQSRKAQTPQTTQIVPLIVYHFTHINTYVPEYSGRHAWKVREMQTGACGEVFWFFWIFQASRHFVVDPLESADLVHRGTLLFGGHS
jgi:hypothetical protein